MKSTTAESFWNEFSHEFIPTLNHLQAVPFDRLDYKPHEKSMSLGALAVHLASILGWWKECLVHDELNFAEGDFTPKTFSNSEALIAYAHDLKDKAKDILESVEESEFDKIWTMRSGDTIYYQLPKRVICRTWCLNHLYHHRAQLGVYLRMLDIPVPSTFGPTADEN
ncbi:MAG: DinB family protein [Chitinophagales bacterium]|jgi:uncharacterized damage-inducible protein DinB|nr:DinB family protein [Chitinophagales bacterium]